MTISLRDDYDGASLRMLARQSVPPEVRLRMLGIAAIYDGQSRKHAAEIAGIGVQILRDWVLRFNAVGPSGLNDSSQKGGGGLRLNRSEQEILMSMLYSTKYVSRFPGGISQNQLLAQFKEESGRSLTRSSLRGYIKKAIGLTGGQPSVKITG